MDDCDHISVCICTPLIAILPGMVWVFGVGLGWEKRWFM
jgi:hypothetical protein